MVEHPHKIEIDFCIFPSFFFSNIVGAFFFTDINGVKVNVSCKGNLPSQQFKGCKAKRRANGAADWVAEVIRNSLLC
jgi:hypothetical protein